MTSFPRPEAHQSSPDGDQTISGELWPYVDGLPDLSLDKEDDISNSKKAINKKNKIHFSSDEPGRLNYRANSRVNGSTRGLTGIMSGMEPRSIIKEFVLLCLTEKNAPVGKGGLSMNTMSHNGDTRIRPGMMLGSKEGWTQPPPPKETDPGNEQHAFDLEDVVHNKKTKSVFNANLEKKRILNKNHSK